MELRLWPWHGLLIVVESELTYGVVLSWYSRKGEYRALVLFRWWKRAQ